MKAGSTCDQLICLTDLMASCADLLGTKLPDNAGEDSVSILPALRGSSAGPCHGAVVHHSMNGRFSLRQGKWKLELCPGSGGWSQPSDAQAVQKGLPSVQLYDMSQDDTERVNVQQKYPEVVERLTRLLEKYVAEGRSTPARRRRTTSGSTCGSNLPSPRPPSRFPRDSERRGDPDSGRNSRFLPKTS